jgi:2,3-bisphosphoglycerate-dependent phosphoglycerate mutase
MYARLIAAAFVLAAATSFVAADPIVFLVRHAEKVEGAADPKNPELSSAGRVRAASLAAMFKDADVKAVFASEYTRTQQTAQEIARVAGVAVTVVPAKETAALITKLQEINGNAVVVGHSNTLPEIIKALGVATDLQIAETEYDNLFIWNRSTPRELVRLRQQPVP